MARIDTSYDRCSIQDQVLPNSAKGSGLCVPGVVLSNNHTANQQIEKLNESLLLVTPVVRGTVPGLATDIAPPFLLRGAPNVLDAVTRFVGGSSFWHANKSLYLHNLHPQHQLDFDRLNTLICNFARKDWLTHFGDLVELATIIVHDMNDAAVRVKMDTGDIAADRATLRGKTFKSWEGFRRNALFCAMLVHSTLYSGLNLRNRYVFQPFNGVVGLYDGQANRNVSYSWTLGRALHEATRAVIGGQVR